MRTIRLAGSVSLFCTVLGSCMMSRVSPYGARLLTDQEVADSLVVLAQLEEHIRRQPRDAEAWHRRGMIGWVLRERDRAKPVKGVDWTMIGRMADTSLRIAKQLKDESVAYQRDVSLFLLASGAAWTPLVTQGRVNSLERRGLDEARLEATPASRAAAIIRIARTYWRAYEHNRARLKISGDWPTTELREAGTVSVVRNLVAKSSRPDPADTSEADYRKAEELFREAYNESPDYPLSFPHLAMVLVAKDRWDELAALATFHLRTANFDPMGWMALGLASHRLGDVAKATTSFEYATRNMPPELRLRLDRLPRVIKPSDSARYALRSPDERAVADRAFWMAADPLWSRRGANPRNEFLARVAYAELLWSLPELNMLGSDTDRGRIHVRYGPPAVVAGPDLVWAYDAGPVFRFDRPDGMATTTLTHPFTAGKIVESLPSTWDNVRIDNMLVTTTRFRAGDSVDVYITSNPYSADSVAGTDSHPLRAHMWLLTADTLIRAHDSLRVTGTQPFGLARRVSPATYAVRTELVRDDTSMYGALGKATLVAGTDAATGFDVRGFGLSDLLYARTVTARGNAATRWSDFEITPQIGPVAAGGTLEVLWEIYDLTARDGQANYDVALTVAQADTRGGLGRIAAEIVGALGSLVGVDRQNNRITSRFTRSVAQGRAIADHVTIGLGETPSGVYTLTVEVTDKATGRTATRARTIVVR